MKYFFAASVYLYINQIAYYSNINNTILSLSFLDRTKQAPKLFYSVS